MTEDDLKSLVRETVARHLAARPSGPGAPAEATAPAGHASFHRYALPRGTEAGGPCLIEPAVACNHCGYCQSHGY